MTANIDPIATIERLFGVTLKKVTATEWAGPCPWCSGTDRFRVWAKGNYWCRPGPGHCGRQGWVDELTGAERPTREQIVEMRLQRLEQIQREHESRLSALERMAHSQDHILYHQALDRNDDAVEWWLGQGINTESLYHYTLGFCPRCPTDRDGRESFTIPVFHQGKLLNIRHRLKGANGGDKYRPHMAGLGNQLFNADKLAGATEILIVEGAKKSIVLDQYGLSSVGIMGKRAFNQEWLDWFTPVRRVNVALDPDATESSFRLAGMFDGRARVVQLPVKPDDFFYLYGGTADQFRDFVKVAKPVDMGKGRR